MSIDYQNHTPVVHLELQIQMPQKLLCEKLCLCRCHTGIDRNVLCKCVLNNKEALAALEAAVHPLVGQARHQFLQQHTTARQPLVVFDIPLLFEEGLQSEVDAVVVVSARYGNSLKFDDCC